MAVDPHGHKVKWWQWLILETLAGATAGWGITILATLANAIIGTLTGYTMAKTTNQDIGETIGVSVLINITLGNIAVGLSYLVSAGLIKNKFASVISFAVGGIIYGGTDWMLQSNSTETDPKQVIVSGLSGGILNTINFMLGGLPNTDLPTVFVGTYVFAFLTGVAGLIIDLIKQGFFKPKGEQ